MKVFAEVRPKSLGRVVYRISNQVKKLFIEHGWEISKNQKEADLRVYFLRAGDQNSVLLKKPYIAFIIDLAFSKKKFLQVVNNSEAVISHIELEQLGFSNYYRTPYGYDPNIFYKQSDIKDDALILTTGYVSETEMIDECHQAANKLGWKFIHVGGKCTNRDGYYKENVTDNELRGLYNRSRFVAGTRTANAFELPIVEGLACGARPICLDRDFYRMWFGDKAIYTKDDTVEALVEAMQKIRPVSDSELEWVKENFSWETIRSGWEQYLKLRGVL